jgi:hypothetical protein
MSDWEEGGIGTGRKVVEVVDETEAAAEPAATPVGPPETEEAPRADLFRPRPSVREETLDDFLSALKVETMAANAALAALKPILEAQGERLSQLAAENQQLRGQLAQLETGLVNHHNWFVQFDARMNALAQQVVGNARFQAMKLATDSRSAGEPMERIVKNAEAYFNFMMIPPPMPPAAIVPAPVEELPGEGAPQEAMNAPAKPTKH